MTENQTQQVQKMNKEFRSIVSDPVDIREDDNGKIKVSGYAAVFNSRANIGDMFEEQIQRGAFTDAIGRDDVVFLINHEGLPMARTRSGTLTLTEDSRGLYIESELDSSDPDVARIIPKMKRGDLDKMSFAFMPEVQEWDDSGDIPLRTITRAALQDVSIVTFPAYQDTEIGLRSYQSECKNQSATRKARMRMKLAIRQC